MLAVKKRYRASVYIDVFVKEEDELRAECLAKQAARIICQDIDFKNGYIDAYGAYVGGVVAYQELPERLGEL